MDLSPGDRSQAASSGQHAPLSGGLQVIADIRHLRSQPRKGGSPEEFPVSLT